MFTTLQVDDQLLFWFRNRFYRSNQFAAAYAQLPIGERFHVLSDAMETFISLAMTKEEFLSLRAMAAAKPAINAHMPKTNVVTRHKVVRFGSTYKAPTEPEAKLYAYLHQRADLRVSRGVIPVGFYSYMLLDEGQPMYLETRYGGTDQDGWPVGPQYQISWTANKEVIPPLDSLSDGWYADFDDLWMNALGYFEKRSLLSEETLEYLDADPFVLFGIDDQLTQQALAKLEKFPALLCDGAVPTLDEWAYYLRIEPKDKDLLWLVRAMMETDLPKPWTCYKGIGSIVCYLRADTGQVTWKHPFYDYFRQLRVFCKQASKDEVMQVRCNRLLWSYEATRVEAEHDQDPLISPMYVARMGEIFGFDVKTQGCVVRNCKAQLKAFAKHYRRTQDVDINLIRDCNEMLQRDLEKYEEMVSHWSGAVKDDVKFDLNKLSKGAQDQPGLGKVRKVKQGQCHVVQGDIGNSAVIAGLHSAFPHPSLGTAGFSCQPWSCLGDGAKTHDNNRASCLPKVLAASYWLKCHSILLECVDEAGADDEVQKMLTQFCAITQYKATQVNLRLEDLMPTRRNRWWCLLVNPTLSAVTLRTLPKLSVPPVLGDMFPFFPTWDAEQLRHLELDRYELNKFAEFQSLFNNVVDLKKPVRTALHGWANQLTGCPCGCRQFPFSERRLRDKGMFGALIPTGGDITTYLGTLPNLRHMHPYEMATIHGAKPNRQWQPQLRLGIAGLGQMASPVPSCWILSQFLSHVMEGAVMKPEGILWHHMQGVYSVIASEHPTIFHHANFQGFINRTYPALEQSAHANMGPAYPIGDQKERSTSHRMGRKDPSSDKEAAQTRGLEETHKQPGPETPELEKMTKQPGTGAPEPEKIGDKQPGSPPGPSPPTANKINQSEPSAEATSVAHDSDEKIVDVIGSISGSSDAPAHAPQAMPEGCPGSSGPSHPIRDASETVSTSAHAAMDSDNHASFDAHPTSGHAPHMDDEDGIGPVTQELLEHVQMHEQANCNGFVNEPSVAYHTVQVFHDDAISPLLIKVPTTTTVGAITVAEDRLHTLTQPIRINSSVGTMLKCGESTKPYQQLFLREMRGCIGRHTGESGFMPPALTCSSPCPRIQTLYHQEGWVADDEMSFYLHMIQSTGTAQVGQPLLLPDHMLDEEVEPMLQRWMCSLAPHDALPGITISAMWVANHWFPIAVKLHAGHVQVFTSPAGIDWMEIATRALGDHITLTPVNINQVFNNDCGFQVVGWLMSAVFDPAFGTPESSVQSAQVDTATAWRGLFENHLRTTDTTDALVIPSSLRFGGAAGHDVSQQLSKLLGERGVPESQVPSRTDLILERVGRQPVTRAMRTKDPWRELKQLANQLSPKLQMVLPSELQEVIRARAAQGDPVGDKRKKTKPDKAPKRMVQLTPADVSIPEGVFRDSSPTGMQQIPFSSIGPEARGLVVLTASEALPYLSIRKPISKHGLALIVLDYMSPAIHEVGQQIRFPARCEKTGEPILLTSQIIQLGSQPVTRSAPDTKTKVEEVSNQVIRTVTYKDELQHVSWASFIAKPVRHVISQVPCLQEDDTGRSPILDVWDRQFLNDRYERTKPGDSSVFVACFRVEKTDAAAIMKDSGRDGHYVEPRAQDGRSPDTNYRVIWLAKGDKQSTILASQSTAQWTCVVRSGTRFGLRVKAEEAEIVHNQHKPNTPFLSSDKVLTFHAGPFPHGANRAALQKLFSQWNWPARPCQPKNRAPNGLGVIWEVQATSKPQFEVYQLQHADVLITEVPRKESKQMPTIDIQGSARTLAALSFAAKKDDTVDPWIADDPWGNYQTPVKVAKTAPTSDQVDVIAAKVVSRLQNTNKLSHVSMDDGDTTMASDERIQEVEQRLQALETNLQQHYDHQQQHNQAVATQIGQIQQQVDLQATSLTQHLDSKMNEQLAHIERLLLDRDPAKKSRME
eukprot:s10_g4.t1